MAGPPLLGPEAIVEPDDPVSSNGSSTRFGHSVALDGNVLAVGSMDDVSAIGHERGAVYVFERIGGLWIQQQKLLAPDGADGDEFGFALDLALDPDGMMDWLIVGAPKAGRISAGPDGRVYLFRRANGGAWTFDSQLFPDPLTEEHSSEFGHGVGIDISEPVNSQTGDLVVTAVVGSPRYEHPSAGGSNHGAIHIYQRVGSPQSFQLSHELYGRNPNPGHTFDHSMQLGWSVAIDRGLIIAGAPIYYASQHQSGAGVLYGRQNQLPGGAFHWAEASFLEAGSAFQQDHLGRSTALSFDSMVGLVGTELYDGQGFASSSGAVYAFDLSTFGLVRTEVQQLLPSDDAAGNQFGASVDVDGRFAVIGAPGARVGSGRGAVYLFEQTSGQPDSWVEIGKISPTGLDTGWSDVGGSVAISKFTTAYGVTQRPGIAPGNEGAAYLNEVAGIFGDGFE
ncbi:FG-GAP repeat protein [Pseudomarimonas salicorniae]|uniref:FG-GAP repeat protein n=1 Tax=Pseudomarimonas salicorniae TaxID=2933270 RepID=A0ABT0GL35_9GAMM|nr:FG-GAP repeat protein [Lysobacter sp. CAU 1642]MCK7595233.1 FG-GAP repeat protein [Lysobacter sp. CAU 1642]